MAAITTDVSPACGLHRSKEPYTTRTRARVVVRKMYRRGGIVGRLDVFRCTGCELWFVGRSVPRALRQRLRRMGRWL
jgi:hypothetical protein